MQLDREYILRMIKGRSAGAVVVEGGEGGGGGGGVTLGPLLTSLNTEAMPSAEGYLHWSGTAWEWTTPTGGDPVDLTPYALKTWVQNNFATLNDISGLLTKEQADGYYAPISFVKPYLPLAAGSSYPLTGSLYINGSNNGIQWSGNKGMLCYKPASGWSGVTSTQWGVGSHDANGIIRSGSALERYDGTNNYTIYDSSNLDPLAYATKDQLSGYLPLTGGEVSDLTVNGAVVAEEFLTSELEELATEDWVEGQGYQTEAIESVSCGGSPLTVSNKSVSIPFAGVNTPGVIQIGEGLTANGNHLEVNTSIIASKDWVNKGYSNGRTTKYVEFPDHSWFNSNNYYSGYGGEDYFKALLKWCVAQIPTWRQNGEISASELNNASLCLTLIGSARPNASGTAIINLYAASGAWSGEDDMDGMPKYASGVYFAPGTSEFVWHFRSWTVQANSAPVWYFRTFDFSSIDADQLDGHHASDFLLLSGGGLTGDLAITDAELKVSNDNGGWVHQVVYTASGASESTYKFYVSQNAQNSTPVTRYEFDKDVKVKKLIADEVQADNINAGLEVIMDDVSVVGKTGRLYVDRGELYYQYDNGTPVRIA